MSPGVICLSAQPAGDGLKIYAGVASYANPEYDSLVRVEFSFSVNRNELTFFRPDEKDNNLYARVFAQVDIFDQSGYAVDSVGTYFSVAVPSREEASRNDVRVFDRLSLMLEPGDYSARLTVIDVANKNDGECFFDRVVVEESDRLKLRLSDVSLLYNIQPAGDASGISNTRLIKNGLLLFPNPNALFTENDTSVYLYGEVYNLKSADTSSGEYSVQYSVVTETGLPFRELGSRVMTKPGASAVLAESFDIKDWPEGSYVLRVVVSDYEANRSDTTLSPFRIISRQALLASISHPTFEYPYDTLSLEARLRLVEYLLTPEQKKTLSVLSAEGKENFLQQYWEENDVNQSTEVIENLLDMMERYIFVNQNFSTNEKQDNGWHTDRGRIYMTYGPWDERDHVPSPRAGNPFDIWHYRSLKEGKHFVFEDWSGTLDYRLVHSNVYGEVYDQAWDETIRKDMLELYR